MDPFEQEYKEQVWWPWVVEQGLPLLTHSLEWGNRQVELLRLDCEAEVDEA